MLRLVMVSGSNLSTGIGDRIARDRIKLCERGKHANLL